MKQLDEIIQFFSDKEIKEAVGAREVDAFIYAACKLQDRLDAQRNEKLHSLASQVGAIIYDIGLLGDTCEELTEHLQNAKAILSTGGWVV
jgi:hypothetical protein